MAPWVKTCFVDFLPKYLFIERPNKEEVAGPFDPLPIPQHSELFLRIRNLRTLVMRIFSFFAAMASDDEDGVEEEVIENCSQHSTSLHKAPCPVTVTASVNRFVIYFFS